MVLSEGYLILALGDVKYYKMACNLAVSIRLRDTGRPICLMHDMSFDIDDDLFNYSQVMGDDKLVGCTNKILIDRYSPFERTLFVDCDCLMVKDDIDFFWDELSNYHFAVQGRKVYEGQWGNMDVATQIKLFDLDYMVKANSGIIYFDDSLQAKAVFDKARDYFADLRSAVSWEFKRLSGQWADEPILCTAMAHYRIEPLPNVVSGKSLMFSTLGSSEHDIDVMSAKCQFLKGTKLVEPTICHFCELQPWAVYERESAKLMVEQQAVKVFKSGSLSNRAIIVVTQRDSLCHFFNCLLSIIGQNYPDLGIVFVDDASTDGSLELGLDALLGRKDTIVLSNREKQPKTKNIDVAVSRFCSNEESVIFLVDGDDWLIGTDAISQMMRCHEDYDVVWSQYEDEWLNRGACGLLDSCDVRGYPWVSSHLKSFKKFLYDAIDKKDFCEADGSYYERAIDQVIMLPVLEMAGRSKWFFYDRMLYHYTYNLNGMGIGAGCEEQRRIASEVREKKPYKPIDNSVHKREMGNVAECGVEWYDSAVELALLPLEKSPWKELYRTVVELLPVLEESGRIVDLGCGTGRLARLLCDKGYRSYIGIDFSQVRISESARYVPDFEFVKADVFEWKGYRLGDVILILEVLEHIIDDLGLLNGLPIGSDIVISVPNFMTKSHVRCFNSIEEVCERYSSKIDIAHQTTVVRSSVNHIFVIQGRIKRGN